MNLLRTTTFALAVAVLPALAGCNRGAPGHDAATTQSAAQEKAGAAQTMIGKVVQKEIEKARTELRNGNLVINGDHDTHFRVGQREIGVHGKSDDALPRAEITPQGDLLVAGKAVDVTPEQRKLLLDYREQVIGIAETGMAIGSKGADLAGTAIKDAIGSIFDGDTEEMEKRVEAQAEQLKQEARVICTRLPAMLAAEQQLAASLPAFAPYADMDQDDVDDCMHDLDDEGASTTQ